MINVIPAVEVIRCSKFDGLKSELGPYGETVAVSAERNPKPAATNEPAAITASEELRSTVPSINTMRRPPVLSNASIGATNP
jgi:hypothetical protein